MALKISKTRDIHHQTGKSDTRRGKSSPDEKIRDKKRKSNIRLKNAIIRAEKRAI